MTLHYPDPSVARQIRTVRLRHRPNRNEQVHGMKREVHRVMEACAQALSQISLDHSEEPVGLNALYDAYGHATKVQLKKTGIGNLSRLIAGGLTFSLSETIRWIHLLDQLEEDPKEILKAIKHPSFRRILFESALLGKGEEAMFQDEFAATQPLVRKSKNKHRIWHPGAFNYRDHVLSLKAVGFERWKKAVTEDETVVRLKPGCPASRVIVLGRGPLSSVYVDNFLDIVSKQWDGRTGAWFSQMIPSHRLLY